MVDPRDPFGKKVTPAGGAALSGGIGRIDNPSYATVADGTRRIDRPARAAQIGKQLQRAYPVLFAEPRVRFPLAVAHLQQGFPREAERFYLTQRRGRPGDPWQRLAAGEEWLTARQAPPPVSVMRCPRVVAKPYLDGKLDDPAWRSVSPQELRSRVDDDKAWRRPCSWRATTSTSIWPPRANVRRAPRRPRRTIAQRVPVRGTRMYRAQLFLGVG